MELMNMEKETTGLYLSGHPMDAYRGTLQKLRAPSIASILEDFSQEGGPTRFRDGQPVTIAGVVTSSKTKTTRYNSLMAYVVVEDATGSIEMLCFSRVLNSCGSYLQANQVIVVQGKLSARDEKVPQIMCDSAYPLETVEGGIPKEAETAQPGSPILQGNTLYLKFPSLQDPAVRHMRLVFEMFPGTVPVKMLMADTRKLYGSSILLHEALVEEAREILGEENVVIK